MMFRLAARGIGAQSVLETRRGSDQAHEVTIDLIAPPETPPRDTRQIDGRAALSGLEVMRINPAVIAEFGLPPEAEGVLVTQARDLAGRAGLRTGRCASGDQRHARGQPRGCRCACRNADPDFG